MNRFHKLLGMTAPASGVDDAASVIDTAAVAYSCNAHLVIT
jgi:hypothetical protein